MKVAATLFLFLSLTVWMFRSNEKTKVNDVALLKDTVDDISAPENGAILILSNLQKVELNETAGHKVINSSTLSAKYNESGELIIDEKETSSVEARMNSLIIPKAKLFQVVLSDHTKVWLNADSRLDFPDQFSATERKVYLKGEAYFEVEKDENRPFIVETEKQQIKVLGTKFNVFSYPESEIEKTSLYHGSVEVTNIVTKQYNLLKPGEEALVSQVDLKTEVISEMNTSEWRNNTFVFEKENLSSVLQKIARWYNVDVSEAGELPNRLLSGKIRTEATLNEVLQIINLASGMDFKLNGNFIIANNK